MISAERARELVEEAKEKRRKELIEFVEKEKISEEIVSRANRGYHNTSFVIKDEYLTVATEHFNSFGFAVSHSPRYSNQTEVEISW